MNYKILNYYDMNTLISFNINCGVLIKNLYISVMLRRLEHLDQWNCVNIKAIWG